MKNKNRGSIKDAETLKLWVKAGGRCELCNEYLLVDDFTEFILNLGERAHNIGVSGGKRSPRSISNLSLDEKNKEENLLLLCRNHHKLIDTNLETYTVDELKTIKIDHEKRIKYLTGLSDDKKSVVLRMLNDIKGNSVIISDEEVRRALYICEKRYPDYLLKTENSVEINLKSLPDKVSVAYWKIAKQKIDSVYENQIKTQANEKKIKHISVFALARIPLLIYLGYRIGDSIPIDVYQKQRNENEDWIWCNDKFNVTFQITKIREGKVKTKVAVLASISGKLHEEELPSFINSDFTLYEIIPDNEEPNRNIIRNKHTLINFKNSYQKLMRRIEREHISLRDLLLFPAIPLSASIYCGRELLKDTSPSLVVYDKEKGNYKKSIIIPRKRSN